MLRNVPKFGEAVLSRLHNLRSLRTEPVSAQPGPVTTDPSRGADMICPFMRSAAAEGKIDRQDEGLGHLFQVLKGEEFSSALAAVTVGVGPFGNRPLQLLRNLVHRSFDPSRLAGGMVDHFADSMVLFDGKFNEDRFQALVSHARHGQMDIPGFAAAIVANVRRDGSHPTAYLKGLPSAIVEFSVLLTAYGKFDPVTREPSIDVDSLRRFYEGKGLPQPSGEANAVTMNRVQLEMARAVKGAFDREPSAGRVDW